MISVMMMMIIESWEEVIGYNTNVSGYGATLVE